MRHASSVRTLPVLHIFWVLLLSVLLLGQHVPTVHAAGAGGVPVLRDFEDLPVGTSVFNQYVGVTFMFGDSSNFDGTPRFTITRPSQATVSGKQALQSIIQKSCEFCGTQMIMRFDVPQDRVSLSTGLASNYANATLLLEGYSGDPTLPNAQPLVRRAAPCLGTGPTPITTPLEVDDNAARITFAQLALVSCSDPTNLSSGAVNGTMVLDNLLYNRPLRPPPGEHNPPVITITSPLNNATVVGSAFGAIDTPIQAAVTENALSSLTAQVNGHPAIPVSYYHVTPQTYSAMTEVTDRDGLVDGTNTVVLTAKDFDRPQNTSTASVTFTFHVKPFPPPSKVDIWPTAFEVTQAIDPGPYLLTSVNWSSPGYSVVVPRDPPLVQGKPTLIRIYGAASGTTTPVSNVPAVAYVRLNNCSTSCDIPGGQGLVPLLPPTTSNSPFTPNVTGLTLPPFGSPDSSPGNVITNLRKTWNFWLQPGWTMQDLAVTIDVNFGRYSGFPEQKPVPECRGGTIEECYYNNQVTLHLHFVPAPQITVDPVFLHVTGTYNGTSYNDVHSDTAQVDAIFQMLNQVYPVKVVQGQRFDRTVGPGTSGDGLVSFMDNNFGSNDQSTLFLGVFPGDKGKFAANNNGILGEAPTNGGQIAWANPDDPFNAIHELGHDIGFDHWGCGHGPDDDECGVFPIPHGSTGVVGTDLAHWKVIPPGDTSNPDNTTHAHDFMTADAEPNTWVSWYTYGILLDHHTVASYDADDPPALLVSGSISPNGSATLRPIYQIDVNHPITDTIVEDDPNDIYTMLGYDGKGNILFVHNFEPFKLDVHTADYGKALVFKEAVPFVANLQRIEVRKGAQVLGALTNPAPGQVPTVSITDPTSGSNWPTGKLQTIRWSSSSPAGVPLYTMVEYSPDGGKTRFPLGRDLTGSTLTINPDELPGSANTMIYVQVSDGVNTATATFGPFTVQPKPPSVHIVSPGRNSQVTANIPLSLEGSAYDRQETLTGIQFKWTSDRDGVLGTGQVLTALKLSVGHHTLTLTVTDSQGRVGRDTIQIDVVPLGGSPPSPPPVHWLIFASIAIALLLLVMVLAILLRRHGRTAGSQG